MEFKAQYSPEEMEEIVAWMESHLDSLPQEMDILPGMHTNNLPEVVRNYIDLVRTKGSNHTYNGQISHLFRIRENIEKTL